MDFISSVTSNEEIFSNQEQIYEFHENLRHGSKESLEQFQSILEVFINDIVNYRKEIKRLEDSFRREKENHERFLQNIEEDQERDIRELEQKTRDEERRKFEIERESIQQKTEKELNELRTNIERLQKIEEIYLDHKSNDENLIVLLREEIEKLSVENRSLNSAMNDCLTTNAILRSDLQTIRNQLNERQTMLLQEKQSSNSNYQERESLQGNVRHLVEINKQLRDENDSLRAIIDAHKLLSTPPQKFVSSTRLASTAGSTLGSYWKTTDFDSPSTSFVAAPDKNQTNLIDFESNDELDSGLSLTTARDATDVEISDSTEQHKYRRSLIRKRENHDETDSDDVFVEISFPRDNIKRSSRQRSSKKNMTDDSVSTRIVNVNLESLPMEKSSSTESTDLQPFDRMFKIVFCGDAAVGKSTLIMRLCRGKFVSNVNSTLGVDFQNKQIELDGKRVALQLWDTAGQERFRSVAKSYFRRCDGVILLYDSTYERSFLNVRDWIETISESTTKKASVMIVANKIDLREEYRLDGKRVIESHEGIRLAKEHGALFIETSAKDGINVEEILIELARDMRCNEDIERHRTHGIALEEIQKKSTCCTGRR